MRKIHLDFEGDYSWVKENYKQGGDDPGIGRIPAVLQLKTSDRNGRF